MPDYDVIYSVSYIINADSREAAREIAFEKHKDRLKNNNIHCWNSNVKERGRAKKDG